MAKLSFLTGFASGYTLGARAGKGRYEQIRSLAGKAMGNPQVQKVQAQATHLAKDQAIKVADVAKDQAGKVASQVKEHVPGHGSSDTSTPAPATPPTTPATPTTVASITSPTTPTTVAGQSDIPTPAEIAPVINEHHHQA